MFQHSVTIKIYEMKKVYILLIVLLTISCKINNNEVSEPISKDKVVKLSFNNDEKLFFKTNMHGITGNHQQIVLTEERDRVYDKDKDYIFYSSEIYYRKTGDSLIVFAPECCFLEPNSKKNKTMISVKGLKNASEIDDYENNYAKYKLERLSVY